MNRSHGHSWKNGKPTPTYNSWKCMKERCNQKNAQNYKFYGDKGVSICDRWLSFENFLEDMGERPEGTTLERININRGYEPDNCKWADIFEQNRNRSTAILTAEDIPRIRDMLACGALQKDIAALFGTVPESISNIKHGRSWKNC